jgi:hypothetical protein
MEILRFEEAQSSAPKQKKSSKGYLAVGLVATLFGIGSAFASSTIAINTNNQISLGQGIATVAGCDSEIKVTPNKNTSGLRLANGAAPTFVLSNIVLEGVDTHRAGYIAETPAQGCYEKDLQVQVFKKAASASSPATQLTCTQLGAATSGLVNILNTDHPNDSKCLDGSIYFRVWSKPETVQDDNSDNGIYTISLTNGSSDFDYITVVSTSNISY